MSFSDTDWQLFELLNEPSREAINGFLDRLERWMGWVETRQPEPIDRALPWRHEFCCSILSLRQMMGRACLPKSDDIYEFFFLAERCAEPLVGGKLREPWATFQGNLLDVDYCAEADRFLELMDDMEAFVGSSPAIALSTFGNCAADDEEELPIHESLFPEDKEVIPETGFSSFKQLQRWSPKFCAHLQGRAFISPHVFLDFALAIEAEAIRLKGEGLAVLSLRARPADSSFKEHRRDPTWSPDQVESISDITRPIASLKASIGERGGKLSNDDEIFHNLLEALIYTADLARPRKRATFTQRKRAAETRQAIHALAPGYWYEGIKRAAWARRIADDSKLQRISRRHGPKRSESISAKTIAEYLKRDFDLLTGQKLCRD